MDQTLEAANQISNNPVRKRGWKRIVFIILAILGASFLFLYWYGSTLERATIFLQPAQVKHGETFSIMADFNNSTAPSEIWFNKLTITDEAGNNILVGANEIRNFSGITDTNSFLKIESNPEASIIYDLGCPLYLSEAGTKQDHTSSLQFTVLANTKPGNYTITIPKNMYCNGLPQSDVRLTLTVE